MQAPRTGDARHNITGNAEALLSASAASTILYVSLKSAPS
jgi:hypothetical protein